MAKSRNGAYGLARLVGHSRISLALNAGYSVASRQQPIRGYSGQMASPTVRPISSLSAANRGMTGVPRGQHKEDGVSRMQFLLDLRRRGVNDVAVLRALDEVARERFVEDRFADDAYAD